ncbi:MAG: hypothetical protein ACLFVX_11135 [Archaeoglobaceae archaeon]
MRLFTIFCMIIALAICLPAGAVTNLDISPENPVKGDEVTLSGRAQPGEEVKIEISFEREINVQDGKYEFSLGSVKIPKGENKFTVIARGCEDLNVSVKMFWKLVGMDIGSEAKDGIAKVSRSAPSGTYDIIIHGNSNQDLVDLKIVATGYVNANENGEFSYSYDTSSIPPGEFKVTAGGISQTVTLLSEEPTPTLTEERGSGGASSGSGGGGRIITTSTDTTTLTSANTTPTLTSTTETPSKISTPSMSSTAKPTETPTAVDTKTPEAVATPTPFWNQPTSTIIVASVVVATIAVLAYALRRG